jgi:hypothetical protein
MVASAASKSIPTNEPRGSCSNRQPPGSVGASLIRYVKPVWVSGPLRSGAGSYSASPSPASTNHAPPGLAVVDRPCTVSARWFA